MSSTAVVYTKDLREAFSELKHFFVKGSQTLAVHFEVSDDYLSITTGSNCLFLKQLPVKTSSNFSVTVTVIDLQFCLGEDELTSLKYTPTGIKLENANLSLLLSNAYSTVPQLPDISKVSFNAINTEHVCSGLKSLTGARLGAVYKKDNSIYVYDNVSVLKYPNVWFTSQTIGLQFKAIVSAEHCRLIEVIEPTEFGYYNADHIVVRNSNTTLLFPCQRLNTDYDVPEMLKDMSDPNRYYLTQYLGQLSVLEKMKVPHVSIGLYEHGLTTSATKDNIDMKFKCGEVTSSLLRTFTVPLPLWSACIKALNSELVEILYKEDTLCLRTASVIILLRVLP